MSKPALTEEELVEAYELDRDACVARLTAREVPREVAALLHEWHEETSLLEEYERLMRMPPGELAALYERTRPWVDAARGFAEAVGIEGEVRVEPTSLLPKR
jgi:hypothetical protein